MTILEELLKQTPKSDKVEQIKIICDKIEEENPLKKDFESIAPKGVNIFLTISVPGTLKNKIAFVTLEREFKDKFIVCLYEKGIATLSKIKSWEVSEDKPEKILEHFAKILKHLRGE